MVHGILDDIIVYYGILWCIMVVVYARTRAHTWTKEVCQLHTPFKTRAQTPAPVNSGVTSVQGQLKTSIRLHIAVRASKLEPSILKYCWVPLPQTLRHALPAPAWPKPARKAGHAKQMRRRGWLTATTALAWSSVPVSRAFCNAVLQLALKMETATWH